ncbi:hypothetical protein RB628_16715 [Streptomyces sp. ADMS]|uniref:hypothetical protein n=1 Tax=Streptomyces sp. ADMS TaxID=3071415 RepID=UPI00296FC2C2|nr:hypothetical protein [Streptomyces sp. ADMS]MDW4906942.1 hypothetical protein [Streptomyces sp. ADMS]
MRTPRWSAPYLVVHERREKERGQRGRRRALWLTVRGVDLKPREINILGVEVTA